MKFSVTDVKYTQDILSNQWSGATAFPLPSLYLTRNYDFYLGNLDAEARFTKSGDPNTVAYGKAVEDFDFQTTRTGWMESIAGSPMMELWHGRTVQGLKKYNFYNDFHPAGYSATPWGENLTILKVKSEAGYSKDEEPVPIRVVVSPTVAEALDNGGCANLGILEYHQNNGIASKTSSNFTLAAGSYAYPNDLPRRIHGPAEICPPSVAIPYYLDEYGLNNIAGFTGIGIGGGFYNSNPIPTSLDLDDYYAVDPDAEGQPTNLESSNKINRTLCPALSLETSVNAARMSDGTSLVGLFDYTSDPVGDELNFGGEETSAYWHFVFKQNANSMPFSNNFEEGLNPDRQINGTLYTRGAGEGTQVFNALVSSEDWWWKHRQCPEPPSFLPWTFGGAINACPRDYFDIPYYAAIGKFGFYGTRFMSACHKLNSGSNESEDAMITYNHYNALLTSSENERRYASFYAGNNAFFLWSNYEHYRYTTGFSGIMENAALSGAFQRMIYPFVQAYGDSINGFLSGSPRVSLKSDMAIVSAPTLSFYPSVKDMQTNERFLEFTRLDTGDLNSAAWKSIFDSYGRFVSNKDNGLGAIQNTGFYSAFVSGKEKRTLTRYLDNWVKGQAVDLYPDGVISFSFDSEDQFANQTGWARRATSVGNNAELPEIDRRYFYGYYGATYLAETDGQDFATIEGNADFFPGFYKNIYCGRDLPAGTYQTVTTGQIRENISGQRYSIKGWQALGYGGLGALESNFSCFTPVFVQNPTTVSCKLGQKPTFRSFAVDYHTLPEDKISPRWPEIQFWANKLKLVKPDGKLRDEYKLKYNWLRIHKSITGYINSGYNETAFTTPYYIEHSNISGDWCCKENLDGEDSTDCTLIHPNLSSIPNNYYQGIMSSHPTKNDSNFGDSDYVYYCRVSGRYGVRTSEFAKLESENFLLFDVAFKNTSAVNSFFVVNFQGKGYDKATNSYIDQSASVTSSPASFEGIVADPDGVPENSVAESQPPPDSAYCNGSKYLFKGLIGYHGATATWNPPHLFDTRGTRSMWGSVLHMGTLQKFKITLSQTMGNFLYGNDHLPTCDNEQTETLNSNKRGIKMTTYYAGMEIRNWQIEQRPFTTERPNVGITYDKLTNVGELFPPSESSVTDNDIFVKYVRTDGIGDYSYGIGHWNFGNNLGAIKRSLNDLMIEDELATSSVKGLAILAFIRDREKNITHAGNLVGGCGYSKSSLGRNMGYFVEAYERYFFLCNEKKKYNIKNKSYISPGMRYDNAAIQYFWLGQPYDTYIKRLPMYGPYAYQWKMMRGNRDRNGNGMSQSFYSYGANGPYDLMYDLPAIYGLYLKKTSYTPSQRTKALAENRAAMILNQLANGASSSPSLASVKGMYWGRAGGGADGCIGFGDQRLDCPRWRSTDADPDEEPISPEMLTVCDWLEAALYVGGNPLFQNYHCNDTALKLGSCFDPCLSIRYDQGLLPGGKKLDMFANKENIRITYNSAHIVNKPSQKIGATTFRGPYGTPYNILKTAIKKAEGNPAHDGSLTPCEGGGSDHCNYITATVNLGEHSYLIGSNNSFNSMASKIFNL